MPDTFHRMLSSNIATALIGVVKSSWPCFLDRFRHRVKNVVHSWSSRLEVVMRLDTLLGDDLGDTLRIMSLARRLPSQHSRSGTIPHMKKSQTRQPQVYTEGHQQVVSCQQCEDSSGHGRRRQALSGREFLDTSGKHSQNETSSALS